MDIHVSRFQDVAPATWEAWVESLQDSTYLHSSAWLGFCHSLMDTSCIQSFAILDQSGMPIAICPLGISRAELGGMVFKEASWNGAPMALPAIKRDFPSQRRRLMRTVFDVLHQEAKRWDASRILLRRHPISVGVLNGDGLPISQVEALSVGYFCQVQNTIVVDLCMSVEGLYQGMTREQRKHLHQSERGGLVIREFRGDSKGISDMHELYQGAHMKSAGALTRPQKSFDYMLALARNGQATLFVAMMEEVPLSFLYCGEFLGFAFGWSQVNLDEFEKENSPRHLLEWNAILSYKQRGFKYYEIGTRWYGPQLYKIPSAKELSIAFFKERYGGQLWPDMVFERFFDRDLFCTQYDLLVHEFLKSGYFEA